MKIVLMIIVLAFTQLSYSQSQTPFVEKLVKYQNSNIIKIPFKDINGYIMIDGKVGAKKGRFIFDTGSPFGFLLNNNFINLSKIEKPISGAAGSGQKFEIYRQQNTDSIFIYNYNYSNIDSINHANFDFIQTGIEKDFLGFIGYEVYSKHKFIIDYKNKFVLFLPLNSSESDVIVKDLYGNEKKITLNFTVGKRKQIPSLKMQIGNKTFSTTFDSGNLGDLIFSKKTINYLKQNGYLNGLTLKGIKFGHHDFLSMKANSIKEGNDELVMGYSFLKNFISIWNYKNQTIELIKNPSP